jgi:hypothetical protein
MTNEQIKAMRQILSVVADAVSAAGPAGCPEGVLYAHLMGYGCTLGQFQSIVGALVTTGKVRKDGHLLYAA